MCSTVISAHGQCPLVTRAAEGTDTFSVGSALVAEAAGTEGSRLLGSGAHVVLQKVPKQLLSLDRST